MRTRRSWLTLAEESRLAVPVLAASGGAGRSTVAGLVAAALSQNGRVLTDTAAPLEPTRQLDAYPGQCVTFAAVAGYRLAVVDTDLPALGELACAHHGTTTTATADWLVEPSAVPVLCVPTTGHGLEDALIVVTLMEALGLPAHRVVVALVDIAPGPLPRRAKASLALLAGRVGPIVGIPHDKRIRAVGLREFRKLGDRTTSAGDALARAVLALAATNPSRPRLVPAGPSKEERKSDELAVAYEPAAR
jgi:hypothetical protein